MPIDPVTAAMLGEIAPAAIAGISSFIGGERANYASARSVREQMQFQEKMVGRKEKFDTSAIEKMQQFQERMSNSQMQRRVADLRAAGLNPALAYQLGGASSPTGGAATGATASGASYDAQDTITPAVSSAIQAKMAREQLANLRQQNSNLKAQEDEARSRTMLNTFNMAQAQAAAQKMRGDNTRGWIHTVTDLASKGLPLAVGAYGLAKGDPTLMMAAIMGNQFSRQSSAKSVMPIPIADADKHFGTGNMPVISSEKLKRNRRR